MFRKYMVTKEVRMLKNRLAKITEKTMMKLVNNEIVLPSTYLETFLEETQKIGDEMNKGYTEFQEGLMSATSLRKMEQKLYGTTEKPCSEALDDIRSDLAILREQLFTDDVTMVRNRVWLYHHKLREDKTFRDSGVLASIRITEYRSIQEEYSLYTWHTLLCKFYEEIVGIIREKHITCEIVRYSEERFLFFLTDMDEEKADRHLMELQKRVVSKTFQHRRKMFRLPFMSATMKYIPRESFNSVLDQLDEKLAVRNIEP